MKEHKILNLLQLTYLFNQKVRHRIQRRSSWSTMEMSFFLKNHVPELKTKVVYDKDITSAHVVKMVMLDE